MFKLKFSFSDCLFTVYSFSLCRNNLVNSLLGFPATQHWTLGSYISHDATEQRLSLNPVW